VQVAHGGHKTYALAGFTLSRQGLAERVDVMENLHQKFLSLNP
jgi:hypothetical protein